MTWDEKVRRIIAVLEDEGFTRSTRTDAEPVAERILNAIGEANE